MAEEQSLNEGLESFADALRSLPPRPAQRERLMLAVWQATTERNLSAARVSLRLWRLATAVSTFVALTFAGLWLSRLMRQSQIEAQIDTAKVEAATHVSEPVEIHAVSPQPQRTDSGTGTASELPNGDFATSYIRQRNRALAEGIETVPVPRVSGGGDSTVPRTSREILDSIFHSQVFGG
jgi:hypothetical protein